MFKFEGISKVFEIDFWKTPVHVLNDVSFQITEGSIVGFLGANGAGKTTAIKILLDFIRPTSGSVTFDKKLGINRQEIIKTIGFLPERPYFYPDLTGSEFLFYIGNLNEIKKNRLKVEAKKWTELLGIDHALNRKLRFYSKGMLQRLGFTAALINNPKLLILDEPLSGLDPLGRKEFKDVITNLGNEGKTIFFSSHIIHDVEEVCKDVVILDSGKILYSGNVHELINKNSTDEYDLILNKDQIEDEKLYIEKRNLNDSMSYSISEASINATLNYLSMNNIEVIKLSKKIPTLENIVYEVGK